MLAKQILSRLRSGALVLLVEEADELIALENAKSAGEQFQPVKVLSGSDLDVVETLQKHKTEQGEGTLILLDFLRIHGSNPIAVRTVREVALQRRAGKQPYSRLILIESPGVQVPDVLRSDIEYMVPKMPSIQDLTEELDIFLKQHQTIELKGDKEAGRYAIASAVAGLPRHEAVRLFARAWVERKSLDTEWLRREKAARVSERLGGALTFIDTQDAPEVGGHEELNRWLDSRKSAFGSETARKFGLPEPKGIFLMGAPGTGKSLEAKTIGKKWGLPLLRLDAGRLFGSLVGQSEAQTRQAIQAAEACAPCVLWIDEIEKGFAGTTGSLDGGTSARVFGTFLTWLQEKSKPVFVVATANRIAAIPPELLRKGRFDDIFFVDLPGVRERQQIAAIHVARRDRSVKDLNPQKIAAATHGFSGAEIEQAIIEAMFNAFSEKRDVRLDDVLEAVKGTVPLSQTMKTEIDALREWAKGRARKAGGGDEAPSKSNGSTPLRAAIA